jgi:hypothetical protein
MSAEGFKVDANALALAGGAPSLRPRDADAWAPAWLWPWWRTRCWWLRWPGG